ncbi:MAG: carbohydrate binding domain-containing protein [Paludibacter sp.]
MRKITLLLSFVACVVFAQAQTNLLTNPGFETWAAGVPTGWTMGTATYATVTQNTALFSEGTSSFKVTAAAASGGTYTVSQIVPITPGKTYTLSMSYYIETGDGTDARIWSDWCNVVTGSTTTYAALLHADSILLMGPGGDKLYFPDVKGAWKTYTAEVTAPATGFNSFSFQFRTYKTPAIVNWDNMFFGEKPTGTSNPLANPFNAYVKGKSLVLDNVANGSSVEIFNALGAKVQSSQLVNGAVALNLTKGLYVVRVGKSTQKFMVK